MGIISKYIGKTHNKCDMCKDSKYTDRYLWVGHITKEKLTICIKCAERENGKKTWEQKNQQLKKL